MQGLFGKEAEICVTHHRVASINKARICRFGAPHELGDCPRRLHSAEEPRNDYTRSFMQAALDNACQEIGNKFGFQHAAACGWIMWMIR
jgi:hypothetical protein